MNYFSDYKSIQSICRYGGGQKHYTLSIVIPTYNKLSSLERAIRSALCQERATIDYSIVIVENYEGDVTETVKLISGLDNPHDIPISYFQNTNNIGMFPNWNRCFELADSEYALMLHTDDYLLPLCVHYVEDAINRGLPAVEFNRLSLHTNNRESEMRAHNEELKQRQSTQSFIQEFHKESIVDLVAGVVPVAPTGFLIKKDLFMETGGFITDAGKNWPSDLEMALSLVDKEQLYYCDSLIVVKTEGDGNWGNHIDAVIELLFAVKKVLTAVCRKHYILGGKQVIYMRLAEMSKWYSIDYHPNLETLFPNYYVNRYFKKIYSVLKTRLRRRLNRR